MSQNIGSLIKRDPRFGEHYCWAYRDHAEFFEVLHWFIAGGLSQNQRVACFVPAGQLEPLRRSLRTTIPIDEVEDSQALILGTFESAYMPDGSFDQEQRIASYERLVRSAQRDGYEGLRVMGDATAILRDPAARESWPGYELRADLLTKQEPLIALCAYDQTTCDDQGMRMIRSLHPDLIGSWDAEPLFHLHASRSGGLRISGEVDFGNSADLERATVDAAKDLAHPVIDLHDLEFLDVSGMRALTAAINALAGTGRAVELRGARPILMRLWNLLDLKDSVPGEVVWA